MSSFGSSAARYILLPGIIPRITALFSEGFVHIAWLTAFVFQSVRLLPPDHPYLNPANRGRYGVRHVIAQAADNLVISRKNIDQILVFSMILTAMALLLIQFILLGVALVAQQPAVAQSIVTVRDLLFVDSVYGHFVEESQDLAFILLDRVFGTKGIFNSCIATDVPCLDLHGNAVYKATSYPYSFHLALHQMLRFYSLGIFFVSVIILLYFIGTMTAETAVSGSPFGERTNKSWAPIRLIVFFGLLVPLNIGGVNGGLNAAQLITLWTAKTGSNFATNGWGYFNDKLTYTYLGEKEKLIATPQMPEIKPLLQFMFVAKTCKMANEALYPEERSTGMGKYGGIQAYIVRPALQNPIMGGPDVLDFKTTDFDTALKHADNGNITIRFGLKKEEEDSSNWGGVIPYCGEMTVNVTDLDGPGQAKSGSSLIQKAYYDLIGDIWLDRGIDMTVFAECLARKTIPAIQKECDHMPGAFFVRTFIEYWGMDFKNEIEGYIEQQVKNGDWAVPPELKAKGWAGAAIWYNRVAQMNGEVTTAMLAVPTISKYPQTMINVMKANEATNENVTSATMFNPFLKNGEKIQFQDRYTEDQAISGSLNAAYMVFENDDLTDSPATRKSGNTFIDIINWLYGSSGIFDMRKNADVHPLAQLSSLGKAMMEASARNLTLSSLASGGKMIFPQLAGMADIAGKFLWAIGWASLSMSFIMYYVLPFMPFIYFFFAVSGWVKSIFEAIVAMPLWALGHLRIDGEGLPGQAASSGYFLLLEIFLRPILTVFGLLAAISIFSALVSVLNEIYDLILANVTGFDMTGNNNNGNGESLSHFMRGPVDEFFLTAMYTILCFMMGQASFKLIDSVPGKILRWIGTSVATFRENAGDPAGEVMSMTYGGIGVATGQIKGGMLAFLGK